jgi:hypothetical protein
MAVHNRTVCFIAVAFVILSFVVYLSVSRWTVKCIKISNETYRRNVEQTAKAEHVNSNKTNQINLLFP